MKVFEELILNLVWKFAEKTMFEVQGNVKKSITAGKGKANQ
jgi:hypothetical protein